MKACKTCGTEVPDNATSCPTCGGPVGDPVVTADGTQPTPQPSPAEPPKKKHTGLKVIAIIAGIIVAIFIIASCNSACQSAGRFHQGRLAYRTACADDSEYGSEMCERNRRQR